jgi:EAL domain-containing protein (putative c-di-GMP-specific phosphodiesterase class I)
VPIADGTAVEELLAQVLAEQTPSVLHLQPVVELATRRLFGHHALFRLPEHPEVSPPQLWEAALRTGRLDALEDRVAALCRGIAVPRSLTRLFVNVHSAAAEPARRWGEVPRVVLELEGEEPHREVAARSLRAARIPFALKLQSPEAGAPLSRLVALRPDYLILGPALVAGLPRDREREAQLRVMATLAREVGTALVAVGIEHAAQAAALLSLGVAYGEGFWIGRPAPPQPE